jgi:hypothetical protein
LVSLRDLRAANGAVKLVRVVHTKRLGLFRQPRTGSTLPVDGRSFSPVNMARTNLGCLIQQTDSLALPCIIVHNPSHHRCMGPLNTHQHMGALLITPHPLTSSHTPWLHPHPLVDRHRLLPYICLFRTQVVPPPHHLIVQAKAPCLPMYLMEPHHHKIHISHFPDLHNLWLPHIPMWG